MARPCFVVAFALIFAGVSLVSGLRHEDQDLSGLDGFQLFTVDDVIVLTEEEADSIEGMPDTIEDNSLSGVRWWKRASEPEASFVDTDWGWFHNIVDKVGDVVQCSFSGDEQRQFVRYTQELMLIKSQLRFLVKGRLPRLESLISAEEERIESAKNKNNFPWTCSGTCTQEQKNAQELDRQKATSAATQVEAAEEAVARYRTRIAGLQNIVKNHPCQTVLDVAGGINHLIKEVGSFIEKNLCLIISFGISAAAAVADKVLAAVVVVGSGGVGGGIAALQAQPWCAAAATGGTDIVSKYVIGSGAAVTMQGVSIMAGASTALCQIGKSAGKVSGEHIKEASKGIMDWNACNFIRFRANVILFALNVACGQLFSGVMYVIKPLIMCNLHVGEGGAKCQTEGCYY